MHRREKSLGAQVKKFNALVDQMALLVRQGKGPRRHTRLPRRLETRKLFKLDVDDDIWQEDPGLGPQDEGELPRWQTDEGVKQGIVAMLEAQRCREELERLQGETQSLACWWAEERTMMRALVEDKSGESSLSDAEVATLTKYSRISCLARNSPGAPACARAAHGHVES